MIATNVEFTIYMIFASLPIIILLILTIGVGLILATVTVFFRDIEHLYGVFIMLLMYASPYFILQKSYQQVSDNTNYKPLLCNYKLS